MLKQSCQSSIFWNANERMKKKKQSNDFFYETFDSHSVDQSTQKFHLQNNSMA